MIPEGWKHTKLEKITSSITVGHVGSTSKFYTTKKNGILFLRTGNITKQGGIVLNDSKYIVPEFHQRLSKSKILPGDILVSRVGLTGSSTVVPDGFPEANCANIIIIRPNEHMDSVFLSSYINSPKAIRENTGYTAGSVQAVLNIGAIKKLNIVVPPLPEQKRIAEILTSVDDAIQATEKVIEQTKKVKQGLLQELLTRGIGHTKFKKTEIGEIPECWEVVKIKDVLLSSTYGINKSLNDNSDYVPVLRMGNIQDNRLDLANLKYCSIQDIDTEKHLLKEGDIVFNRTNSYDLVGKVALIDTNMQLSYASYLIRLRTNELGYSKWLIELLGSQAMQSKLKSIATLGVSQCNINPTKMKNIHIPLPPLGEQAQLVKIFESINEEIFKNQSKISSLHRTKTGLMQDLLTGRVRVRGVA